MPKVQVAAKFFIFSPLAEGRIRNLGESLSSQSLIEVVMLILPEHVSKKLHLLVAVLTTTAAVFVLGHPTFVVGSEAPITQFHDNSSSIEFVAVPRPMPIVRVSDLSASETKQVLRKIERQDLLSALTRAQDRKLSAAILLKRFSKPLAFEDLQRVLAVQNPADTAALLEQAGLDSASGGRWCRQITNGRPLVGAQAFLRAAEQLESSVPVIAKTADAFTTHPGELHLDVMKAGYRAVATLCVLEHNNALRLQASSQTQTVRNS